MRTTWKIAAWTEARVARGAQVGVGQFAAVYDDGAGELEDRVRARRRGDGSAGGLDVVLRKADLAAYQRVRAEAVVADIRLRDRERDLLADLAVESAAGEGAAEVQVPFERGRSVREHAREVGDDAHLGLDGVEQGAGFAGGDCGIDGLDTGHVGFSFGIGCLPRCCDGIPRPTSVAMRDGIIKCL